MKLIIPTQVGQIQELKQTQSKTPSPVDATEPLHKAYEMAAEGGKIQQEESSACSPQPKSKMDGNVLKKGLKKAASMGRPAREIISQLFHRKTQHLPRYVGKFDYDSRTDDDLGFKKGDLMYVISIDDDDWWWVRSEKTGKEGYVPSNYVVEKGSLEAEP